jgi:hypothetical protein
MSDGQVLLTVLTLLYLLECFSWTNTHTVAFCAVFGKSWCMWTANPLFGNSNGSFIFVNPLYVVERVLLCSLSPLSISPAGICAYNIQSLLNKARPMQSGLALSFENIDKVSRDGTYLEINNERFVRCRTTEQVRELIGVIENAMNSHPSEREDIVQSFIKRQFDPEQAALSLLRLPALKSVEALSVLLFGLMFLAIPSLMYIYGVPSLMIPSAVALITFTLIVSFLFFRNHARLYPEDKEQRITDTVTMVLCPPAAIKSVRLLSANLLSTFSPIVIADLLRVRDRDHFTESYLRDLKHPLEHDLSDSIAVEIASWHLTQQLYSATEYLRNHNFTKLVDQVPSRDDGSLAYCPRCLSTFAVKVGECPACPGVELSCFAEQNQQKNNL